MGFRFKRREGVSAGVRRIVKEQIDRAVAEIDDPETDRDAAVHQVRKRFKKIRSVLRLARKPLGKRRKKENERYRDFSRRLSDSRDAVVLVRTFDGLIEQFQPYLRPESLDPVRKHLITQRDQLRHDPDDLEQELIRLKEDLIEARSAVDDWRLSKKDFSQLEPGWKAAYQQARERMAEAGNADDDEPLHDWRKRVKDQWYHTRLLEKVDPDRMADRRRQLRELSELLGDDHDLSMLADCLVGLAEPVEPRSRQVLLALIEIRRGELQTAAFDLGERLFAEKPSERADRIRKRWQKFRKSSRQAPPPSAESDPAIKAHQNGRLTPLTEDPAVNRGA